ncbi:MAG: Gfo/Idh/MocA family oxidoreductase [Chloroflexi bacterium]|nr:Gfo/Idh/MocA family oxidoreductase [Chloroflexota bacterium]
MPDKIRLGFVGANVNSNWSSQSHYPALLASPDVEFTAVCTSRPESAEEARQAFGAKLAFHDFREMVASPDIDAVAVVVRVPLHYEPTKAAIEAGKHVYTEWPLGRNTAEAEELAALAKAKGVQTVVGLQSRVSPALLYIKELIEGGYVGEVLSCHVTTMRDGALERPSSRTWQRDINLGANTLTIANGHVIDALRFVLGNFSRVACMVTTQVPKLYETDTKQFVDVTAPDNVRVSGQLERGAAASVHVGAVPWAGSGFRMEIYGREGTLVTTGSVSSQRGEMLRVQGVQGGHDLQDLAIPERFVYVPDDFPRGDPFNVGQMYALFAEAVRTGKNRLPTFDTAVELHRFLDTIKEASDAGRELPVA